MLSHKTGSLIEKARATKDGVLLNQALELERARLRDHGAREGRDKFNGKNSIKFLKGPNDYYGYKKDCLAAFQQFHAGLECINYIPVAAQGRIVRRPIWLRSDLVLHKIT